MMPEEEFDLTLDDLGDVDWDEVDIADHELFCDNCGKLQCQGAKGCQCSPELEG